MGLGNRCEKCGGSMEFNPSTSGLICRKCGSTTTFESSNNYSSHVFNMDVEASEQKFEPEVLSSHCSNCGAIYGADTSNIADKCEYCGAHLVRDFSLANESKPDACIPFAFDKNTAKQKFKDGLASKKFLPSKFKKDVPDGGIESEYIPAYLFNIETENQYSGRIYRTYSNSDGSRDKSYRNIAGIEKVVSNNILIECSSKINQLTLDKIRPFDLNNLKAFTNEFLLGYSVEYYDKQLENIKSMVKETVKYNVRKQILRKYSYDGVDYLNINTKYNSCAYSRVLLPTYRFSYKYGGKDYNTYINGQTGKVGGNLPRSKFKITAFVLGIIGVVGLLLYFLLT